MQDGYRKKAFLVVPVRVLFEEDRVKVIGFRVYIHTYIHIYIHTHTHTYIYIYTYRCMHTLLCTYLYV